MENKELPNPKLRKGFPTDILFKYKRLEDFEINTKKNKCYIL